MLDEAVAHVARDSHAAAERLLIAALNAAASLDAFSERGRVVPEWNQASSRAEATSSSSSSGTSSAGRWRARPATMVP